MPDSVQGAAALYCNRPVEQLSSAGHRDPSSAAGWRLDVTAKEPATCDVVNGVYSSWQAEEPTTMVNGWQQTDKLDVTASGRRDCVVR